MISMPDDIKYTMLLSRRTGLKTIGSLRARAGDTVWFKFTNVHPRTEGGQDL